MSPTSPINNTVDLFRAVGTIEGQLPGLLADVATIKELVADIPTLKKQIDSVNSHVASNVDPHIVTFVEWKNRVIGMTLIFSAGSFVLGVIATIIAIRDVV